MFEGLFVSLGPGPEVIKLFSFSALTAKHEILTAHKF